MAPEATSSEDNGASLLMTLVLKGVFPEADESVSHEASLAAVQEIVPEPRFEIVRFWDAGPG